MAGLDLAVQIEPRRAGDMRALARVGPWRGVQPVLDRGLHQLVIGGVEAHQIGAAAVAIMGVEFRQMPVRQRAELEILGRADPGAEIGNIVGGPFGALTRHRLDQRPVGGEQIVVGEFDRLVDHLVGDGAVAVGDGGVEHSGPPGAAPLALAMVRQAS